jgi:hypothetical protein
MRKIIATARLSLDGVMQGPGAPKRTVMGSISADGSRNFEMVRVVPQF